MEIGEPHGRERGKIVGVQRGDQQKRSTWLVKSVKQGLNGLLDTEVASTRP